MRFMILVKATDQSEAGEMPSQELLEQMQKYNEELVKAGVLLAGYSSAATLNMGNPFLLPTIAAVVIGGARVTGGRGLYLGTFAGALFLSTLETMITVLSLSQGLRDLIQGAIIISALIAQNNRRESSKG